MTEAGAVTEAKGAKADLPSAASLTRRQLETILPATTTTTTTSPSLLSRQRPVNGTSVLETKV